MQFVNIAVHSVEDVNYRVHLQHEFTLLGLDGYLDVCAFLHTRVEFCSYFQFLNLHTHMTVLRPFVRLPG